MFNTVYIILYRHFILPFLLGYTPTISINSIGSALCQSSMAMDNHYLQFKCWIFYFQV